MRDEFNARLRAFVKSRRLGRVVIEMDFKLLGETVRRSDVAFILAERLRGINLSQFPCRWLRTL